MRTSNLWVIDRDGRVFLFNLRDNFWREISTPKLGSRNCFKRISAVEQCAWAISASQQLYLFVHATELPIRVKVETYENERWGMFGGWSHTDRAILKHTDRWAWSSKDGKTHLPKESFQLPSVEWIWEADWYIDHGIEGDNEGWQYALDFPRTFYPRKEKTSCVRRRLWSRHYRFDGYEHWIKIPGLSDDPTQEPFQDISVGGTSIPGSNPSYLALWAVTFQGKVVYRSGISEKCPEGESWIEIPSPQVSITQLSVSQSGVVWGVTWEGVAVVRSGVTYYQPTGIAWEVVSPPHMPKELGACRLLQVSAGLNSVWALTKDGQVWFRKGLSRTNGVQENTVTGTKWVEMVGKFSLLAVGQNDQVFALNSLGDHIYFRTDVTSSELVGRTWKIVRMKKPKMCCSDDSSFESLTCEGSPEQANRDAFAESDDNFGLTHSISNLPCNIEFLTWLNSGACNVDASFFTDISGRLLSSVSSFSLISLSSKDATWRKMVIQKLRLRDKTESSCFNLYEEAISQGEWCKRGHFQILFDTNSNLWYDCFVKLDHGGETKQGGLLCYHEKSSGYEELRIPLCDITCVCIVCKMSRNHCFAIHTPLRTQQRNPLVIHAGSEKELNDWVATLSMAVSRVHKCEGPASPKAIWATSLCGDVFFCDNPLLESEMQPAQLIWCQVGGHMRKVESGVAGVVWALSFESVPYCYSGGYGGGIFTGFVGSIDGIYHQEDYEWHYIYENQRWNPLDGFSDRRLPSDRWNWSDETGVYERTREGYCLPSSQWQWADEQWSVETKPNITDKDGWQYAVDFPRSYHRERSWHDYVRRRCWKRRSKLTTTGPWIQVTPQVKLRDLSIQIDKQDSSVAVWTVGIKGDVLYRHGVTEQCPQGTAWEHILTDVPFSSISVGAKQRVWGIAENGTAYFRAGFGDNNITGNRWFHISQRPPHLSLVSAGGASVWACDGNGKCWYRQDITSSYPEGTVWQSQPFDVTSLSVGANNQVWMLNRNSIERRYKITPGDPIGRGLEIVLSESWRSVSIRSSAGIEDGVDEAEDVVKQVSLTEASSLMTKLDLSDVDIYSSYSRDEETMGRE